MHGQHKQHAQHGQHAQGHESRRRESGKWTRNRLKHPIYPIAGQHHPHYEPNFSLSGDIIPEHSDSSPEFHPKFGGNHAENHGLLRVAPVHEKLSDLHRYHSHPRDPRVKQVEGKIEEFDTQNQSWLAFVRESFRTFKTYLLQECLLCFQEHSPFPALPEEQEMDKLACTLHKHHEHLEPLHHEESLTLPLPAGTQQCPIARRRSHHAALKYGHGDAHAFRHTEQGLDSQDVLVEAPKVSDLSRTPGFTNKVLEEEHIQDLSLVVYRFIGKLAYINALQHRVRIESLRHTTHLVLSFRYCFYIDVDGVEFLEDIVKEFESKKNHIVYLCSIHPMLEMVCRSPLFKEKKDQGRLFKSHREALDYIDRETGGILVVSPSETNEDEDEDED